jgi:hypothetical protein
VSLYDISRSYFAASIDCIVQVNGVAGAPAARPAVLPALTLTFNQRSSPPQQEGWPPAPTEVEL